MTPAEIAFARIEEKLLESVSDVDCTPAEYQAGLQDLIESLTSQLNASIDMKGDE